MKRFIPRTPAVSVATLCLRNRSGAFSKLRVTGAARRVLGILMTAPLGVVLSAQPASAAVTFSKVADVTTTAPGQGPFTSFTTGPAVSGGNVAFGGTSSGGRGIYTGSTSATGAAKVVDYGDNAPGHGVFTALSLLPSVSGNNVLASGSYSGGSGIYTGTVGATGLVKIVDTDDIVPGHGAFTGFGLPSISGNNVVFAGGNLSIGCIMTATVGATGATKIVDTGDNAPGHGAFTLLANPPSISGSHVAFRGGYSGGEGIYTGSVGATGAAKIADTGDTAPGHGAFTSFGIFPSISGNNVGFRGDYSGGTGIYTGSFGTAGVAKVVETGDTAPGHGPFTGFGNGSSVVSVSGNNVAFRGDYSGGSSLYVATGGAGGSLLVVLNKGDALFGSTVSGFDMSVFGYDNNAIGFSYVLADGSNGIAVATIGVPEPATGVLGVVAVFLLWGWRKRFRTGRETFWFSLRAVSKLPLVASLIPFCAIGLLLPRPGMAAITIPTVPVGNVGNASDPVDGDSVTAGMQNLGSVGYAYNIGKYEVTNAQYAAFLNEKAKSDPLGLYNMNMGSFAIGGITQGGLSGSFNYTLKTNMANKPVNYVSWYDAIRFANWLHNGQGTGDTETGAYTLGLLIPDGTPVNGDIITRNAGATWFLPSENEWYKAAYYQPAAQGGDADNYWAYPTASNSAPTLAAANGAGDISNPGTNVANYNSGANWNGVDGNLTTVGSAGALSQSFYGTSDQGGNVWEMNDSLSSVGSDARVMRGGFFQNLSPQLQSSFSTNIYTGYFYPTEGPNKGFRVATIPEPSSGVLAICACGLMRCWRRRFK